MQFNLITNLTNGVGLQQDYWLLKAALEARGHAVRGVQFNATPLLIQRADINVFLEVVNPLAFTAAPVQWVVPNPEWWATAWDAYRWDRVLAKTHDCERIFTQKVGVRCQYTGWMARDLYQPTLPRTRKFLHVAGKSRFKNTVAVLGGCEIAQVPVTVVGETGGGIRRVPDEALSLMMNTHFCQVMPSAYEGYGQVLHEAQGVGQVIITTDAPPMQDVRPSIRIPSAGTRVHHAGLLHTVTPAAVAEAVQTVLALTEAEVQQYREAGRAQYLADQAQFHTALDVLVGGRR